MGYKEFQRRALEVLEQGQKGDALSRFCDSLIALLVVFNILAVTLESVSDYSEKFGTQFYVFEFFSVLIFSIEYAMRLWTSAAKQNQSEKKGEEKLDSLRKITGSLEKRLN